MVLEDYIEKLKAKLTPQELEGIDTVINFDLKGKHVHLIIKDGKLESNTGHDDNAEVSISAKEEDLMSVVSGDTNPMMAMMMGKLKISNPGAMMKYAKILGLM